MSRPGADVISADDLTRAVRRATEAGIPVADVRLNGPGSPLEPARGEAGALYRADEISVRELTLPGSGALDGGAVLHPPPQEGVRRVIVVPLKHGNWLPYSEALERAVVESAQ
jgi:hypothetical protein